MTGNGQAILNALAPRRADLRRMGVRRLALFGSSVRGEAGEASDLDFLVEIDPKSFDAHMDVKFFLEDLLGRKVDLVLADALKPRLRPRILAEAVDVPGLRTSARPAGPPLDRHPCRPGASLSSPLRLIHSGIQPIHFSPLNGPSSGGGGV